MPSSSLLSRRSAVTIREVFRLLLTERYTGSVTFHFSNGRPHVVEAGRPARIPVYYAPDEPDDQPATSIHPLTVSCE